MAFMGTAAGGPGSGGGGGGGVSGCAPSAGSGGAASGGGSGQMALPRSSAGESAHPASVNLSLPPAVAGTVRQVSGKLSQWFSRRSSKDAGAGGGALGGVLGGGSDGGGSASGGGLGSTASADVGSLIDLEPSSPTPAQYGVGDGGAGDDGGDYYGERSRNGLMNGRGVLYRRLDGSVYLGHWIGGREHGFGMELVGATEPWAAQEADAKEVGNQEEEEEEGEPIDGPQLFRYACPSGAP